MTCPTWALFIEIISVAHMCSDYFNYLLNIYWVSNRIIYMAIGCRQIGLHEIRTTLW